MQSLLSSLLSSGNVKDQAKSEALLNYYLFQTITTITITQQLQSQCTDSTNLGKMNSECCYQLIIIIYKSGKINQGQIKIKPNTPIIHNKSNQNPTKPQHQTPQNPQYLKPQKPTTLSPNNPKTPTSNTPKTKYPAPPEAPYIINSIPQQPKTPTPQNPTNSLHKTPKDPQTLQ